MVIIIRFMMIYGTRVGRFVTTTTAGEEVRAYVPEPLPPDPDLDLLPLISALSKAERALGRLDGLTALLPRPELFLYMYVRKEAVLSSQIEGTQSTLADLLRFEIDAKAGSPISDVREVSNYVDAMMHGLQRLDTLPLSLRLIREMHARLLAHGRGSGLLPGEFRRSQNWIGGTRPGNALFVPPPVPEMHESLHAFETFMHDTHSQLPALITAGLLHVQFETIHPFLDGNGRLGRLLVTLYLCARGVLRTPMLYVSLYLKTHRAEYYRLLQEVRETGNWEAWLSFFLEGVEASATQGYDSASRIVALDREDRGRIVRECARPGSALRIYDMLQQHPYAVSTRLIRATGLTAPTVNLALADLERIGILKEITGRRRGRVYAYESYLAILSEGMEPLANA